MRSLLLILLLVTLGCGGDSPADPDGSDEVCPDQAYAELNLLFGRLADALYHLDVAQMLLLKGASDRFTTPVADHDSVYSRQEMYDVIVAAALGWQYGDSVVTLMDEIEGAADSLDPDGEWAAPFGEWRLSVEEALAFGDSTYRRTRAHAHEIAFALAPDSTRPQTIAIACAARKVDPSFEGLADFLEGADDRDWVEFLPAFVACASPYLSEGWGEFVRGTVAAVADRRRPFLGPVGRAVLDELPATEPGWPAIEAWAGASGAVRLDLTGNGGTRPALALLIDRSTGLASYHPFFQNQAVLLAPVPPGSYRVLVLSSGARPVVSGTFDLGDGETATVAPATTPFATENCVLTGGDVTLWVVNASSDEHLANDFDVKCRSEVWNGTAIFQVEVADAPGVRIRSGGEFSFVVDCDDQSIGGSGLGTVTIEPQDTARCAVTDPGPIYFVFQVSGARSIDGMVVAFSKEEIPLLLEVTCPAGSTFTRNVTTQIFPDREVSLVIGNARRASSVFPPSATPEGPAYIFTEVRREF